ncbi:MAG: adenylyltransferase/cytidyltransferase family protein [Candidatus Bathyarchaeia archaeon]
MELRRRRVVLATGAFDLLHYGHLRFLEEAKRAGGPGSRLIVIVARDKTVKARKGAAPVLPEDQRRALVEALKPVEKAILGFEQMDMESVIVKVKPDVIAVGYDQEDIYSAVEGLVREKGYRVRVARIGRFGPDDLDSSSKIKRRVVESFSRSSPSPLNRP